MKRIATLFLFVIPIVTFSQSIIKGHVSDEIGPLSGANIIIKETKVGVVSGVDGNYEINVKKTDTLLISYLGYETKQMIVANNKLPKTVLKGNIALDEVLVIGYGSHRYCRTSCCGYSILTVQDNSKSNSIKETLFPNPSKNGNFQLKLLTDYKKVEIQAYNISGNLIKTKVGTPYNRILQVDLSSFPSGIYIINIIADGKRLMPKKAIVG